MAVSKTKRKFAFDVSWVFIGSGAGLAILFLRKAVLARYLGPGDLGLFSMCIMVAGIFSLVAGFGFDSAIVKYVAEYKDKEDKHKFSQYVSSAILTMAIFGIASSIILFILSDTLASIFNMPSLSLLLKIFAFTFPFSLIITIVFGFLNGLREMNDYTCADISRGSLTFLIIVIFIFTGFGVRGAVLGYTLAEIVTACIFIILIRKYYVHFTARAYKQTTKKLISFGSRMVAGNAVNLIANSTDILLIGYFLTATDVGYYSIAIALLKPLLFIPQAIQRVTYPATTEYWSNNNRAGLNKMINKSMKYSACLLSLIGLGVGFYAKEIITFVFGKEFIYAALPLCVLLIARVIRGGTIVSIGGSLAGAGRPGLSLKTDAISATANIVLNILLIPAFGILGAALATAISLILGTIVFLIFIVKTLSVQIDVKWYMQITGLALTVVILFFIGGKFINHYLLGLIILSIYTAMIIKFFITKEDREMFKSLTCSLIHRR